MADRDPHLARAGHNILIMDDHSLPGPEVQAAGWSSHNHVYIYNQLSLCSAAPRHTLCTNVLFSFRPNMVQGAPPVRARKSCKRPAWHPRYDGAGKHHHCGQQSVFVAVYWGEVALLSLAVLIWRAGRHRPQLGSEVPKLSASIQLPSRYVSPGPAEPGRGNIILVSVTDCSWSYQSPEVNLSWCTALNIHYYTLKASGFVM